MLRFFSTMADSNNKNVIGYIASTIETMRDQMATKSDVVRLEDRIGVETTAIRGDIEQVQLRLDSMEHSIASRFETLKAKSAGCAALSTSSAKIVPMFCDSSVTKPPNYEN